MARKRFAFIWAHPKEDVIALTIARTKEEAANKFGVSKYFLENFGYQKTDSGDDFAKAKSQPAKVWYKDATDPKSCWLAEHPKQYI